MKIALISLMLFLVAFLVNAQETNYPDVEFTNTGLYKIRSISSNDTSTLVKLDITYLPGRWTAFGSYLSLEDVNSGKKYKLESIHGKKMDEKIFTPNSGDTTIVLVFQKLDKSVKVINYIEGDKTLLYGVNLKKKKEQNKSKEIPKPVLSWINQEIAKSKKKELTTTFNKDNFFHKDSIKIVGYIKGYDKRAGFSSGIIYNANELTREDFPSTIKINNDGKFEVSIEVNNPVNNYMLIHNKHIPFYAEPGMTIGMILDWEDFLLEDRFRDNSYSFKKTQYLGATKSINEELMEYTRRYTDYKKLEDYRNKTKPNDFKLAQIEIWNKNKKEMDSLWSLKNVSSLSKNILKNQLDIEHINYLLEYTFFREKDAKKDSTNEVLKIPLGKSYFDFLKEIDLNNYSLMTLYDFSTFINRFEYSEPYRNSKIINRKDYYEALDSMARENFAEDPFNLIFNVAKMRDISGRIRRRPLTDELQNQIDYASQTFNNPFFNLEIQRLIQENKIKEKGYELPNTAAANVFRKIIDPHKGKVLIIDFWAEWCGPCRSGIEYSLAMRKKLEDNPNVDFIFITDIESTGEQFFKEYSEKNLMKNSHRVTADEYLALRELFKFNGIPRYVLVDDKGLIKDDNFQNHNVAYELTSKFPEKFKYEMFQ